MTPAFCPISYTIGTRQQQLRYWAKPGSSLFLLRLHGNEMEARMTGEWWVKQYGGQFLDVDNATREIQFDYQGQIIAVDPNRIFSRAGIRQSLLDYGCPATPDIIEAVMPLTTTLLNQLQQHTTLIALHNNIRFNSHYYLPDGPCSGSAAAIAIQPTENPHHFILVTQPTDFTALQAQGLNVILIHRTQVDYPGSLSEYCIQQSIRYFNIETQAGDFKAQQRLLQAVAQLIV